MKPLMSAKKRRRSKSPAISTSSTSSSAEEIAGIIDLLIEILVRLPVKSLIKFKCVSKGWLSLISNRDFCSRHCSSSPNVVSGIFLSKNFNEEEFDYVALDERSGPALSEYLTFVNHPEGLNIRQSCNGLLLCYSGGWRNHDYYICNPTTRQYTTLPKPHCDVDDSNNYQVLFLAFDPSKSPHYKVVDVFYEYGYFYPCHIEVYSSDTACWKVSRNPDRFDEFSQCYVGGVFWNDAFHWASLDEPCFYFDVEQEELRKLPMPPNPEGFLDGTELSRIRYSGESGDHFYIARVFDNIRFDVMEMKRDCSGWFVKYIVNLDTLCSVYPEMIENEENFREDFLFIPISIVGSKTDDEESFMVMHILGKVIRYNFKNETSKVLFEYDHDRNVYYNSYRYVESLACA